MRKIQYPDSKKMQVLLNEYQNIFSDHLSTLQKAWSPLRDQLRKYSLNPACNNIYPDNIDDIFIKTYAELTDMYLDYIIIQQDTKKRKF